MSNENANTESSKRERLPIEKTLFKGGTALENSVIVPGVDGLRLAYAPEGETPVVLADVQLNDLSGPVREALAIVGLRYFFQLAIQGADKEADETNEDLAGILETRISDRLASIKEGQFSERGGERGANLVTVAKVVAVMKGEMSADDAKAANAEHPTIATKLANLKTQQANLSIKDPQDDPGKHFNEFLKLLRTRKEYRETARTMFPRKGGTGRKPKVATDDLIGNL